MKTKAAILYQLNKPLRIEEIEIPRLKKGQLLVKMLSSGICRRQLNEIKGYYGEDKYLPHLLGHEGSGEVIDTGEGVTKVKKGDYVVLSWIKGQGEDVSSCQYKSKGKIVNSGAVTTFAKHAVVSENRVVKIGRKVPPAVGAVLGCAIPTGIGILRHTLKVKRGSSIAIFGVGGVGTSVVLGARMLGLRTIIAVDIVQEKLAFAQSLGATHTVNFQTENVYSAISSIVKSGVDYAVEAAGKKQAMEAAFAATKDTGTVAIAGNLKKGETICLDPFDLILGKKILGSWGGETKPDEDFPYYAKEYLAGHLKLDKLITQKFRLEDINRALELMEKGKSLGRMVVEF